MKYLCSFFIYAVLFALCICTSMPKPKEASKGGLKYQCPLKRCIPTDSSSLKADLPAYDRLVECEKQCQQKSGKGESEKPKVWANATHGPVVVSAEIKEDFKKVDKNKDSSLSLDEFITFHTHKSSASKALTYKERKEQTEKFEQIDIDKNNKITLDEFNKYYGAASTKPNHHVAPRPTKSPVEIKKIFEKLDKNKDGSLNLEELLTLNSKNRTVFTADEKKAAKPLFDRLDKDKNGKISFEEFRDHGDLKDESPKHEKESEKLDKNKFDKADKNKDGNLNLEEFETLFQPKKQNAKAIFDKADKDKNKKISLSELLNISDDEEKAGDKHKHDHKHPEGGAAAYRYQCPDKQCIPIKNHSGLIMDISAYESKSECEKNCPPKPECYFCKDKKTHECVPGYGMGCHSPLKSFNTPSMCKLNCK